MIRKLSESHTVQNTACRGRKWKILKTTERKLVRDVFTDPRRTTKTRVSDVVMSGIVF